MTVRGCEWMPGATSGNSSLTADGERRHLIKSNLPTIASVKPSSLLELHGRGLQLREGCFDCHSRMMRPLRYEAEPCGEYS